MIQQLDLTDKQVLIWNTILENPQYRRILLDGGARSTKTMLICVWLLKEANTYAGCRILMARKTRVSAEKSLWGETLTLLCRNMPGYKMNQGDLEIHFKNGSLIRVDGLDDQDRVDKILGTEYSHIFFNEATQFSYLTVQTVLSRLAQNIEGMPARKAIFDCNPKSQRHWLYKLGVKNIDPETNEPLIDKDCWARVNWTPYDNPYLPHDALQTLEALTGTQRRRMLDGVWCEQAGAVYNEFEEGINVIKGKLPADFIYYKRIRAIDFGYINPFVCLWGAIDGDGRLYIYKEYYKRQQTVQVHSQYIKNYEPKENYRWTVADHDSEDRATLSANGITTLSAKKDVETGIKAIKERLKKQGDGKPRLFIHESCVETISEFYDYNWETPKEGKNYKEEPVKDRDHAMDALRYMVMQIDGVGSKGNYESFVFKNNNDNFNIT